MDRRTIIDAGESDWAKELAAFANEQARQSEDMGARLRAGPDVSSFLEEKIVAAREKARHIAARAGADSYSISVNLIPPSVSISISFSLRRDTLP